MVDEACCPSPTTAKTPAARAGIGWPPLSASLPRGALPRGEYDDPHHDYPAIDLPAGTARRCTRSAPTRS